ncbi:hypothetical protein N7510_006126 [Penicillium lagena]|uniref:uncharacterized protein n=1 Tax=Penicillium lagena TaxID=94218 RepID=UPI002542421B|nr:uncharacterized protein N7510_006126 [Penicillium lagena]KAJ5612932.1 hypothetical protein N7510_006126 [Penicillium lagena]
MMRAYQPLVLNNNDISEQCPFRDITPDEHAKSWKESTDQWSLLTTALTTASANTWREIASSCAPSGGPGIGSPRARYGVTD